MLYHVPIQAFGDSVIPALSGPADASDQFPGFECGGPGPCAHGRLASGRHSCRRDVPAFPHQIDDRHVLLPLLRMRDVQISQFAPSRTAAKQPARIARSYLPLRVLLLAACQNRRASSAVSQFPSLKPKFSAPIRRRLPAASSGLSEPTSAASQLTVAQRQLLF